MGSLIRKVAEVGIKASQRIGKIDVTDPMTQDTASMIIDIAKEIIKPF